MHAVVFDIDGTLLQSSDADGALYIAAIQKVLGKVRIRENWGEYEHVTDSGILDQILRDNALGRDPNVIATIKNTFVETLRCHIEDYGPFKEVPGALKFLNDMYEATSRRFAYATGSWAAAALLKLESAGFPVKGVPLSSSDHSPQRRAIMENALRQLGPYDTVTYYGDGKWDREAALSLGWRFMPVGAALGGITRFERSGASAVFR
jgi:phosphoglycolate phosphatase-like HAD superfamily hydrolase